MKMQEQVKEKTAVGKKALVLAGGGLAGMAYELGALYAMDRTLVDMTVNDFDIYVGTSAGATVSALLANGFSPRMILKAIDGNHHEMRPFLRQDLWRINLDHFLLALKRIPRRLRQARQRYLRDFRDSYLFGSMWVLLDLLPSSLYDSATLEEYLRDLITTLGGSNAFSELEKELDIIATRLDSGQRTVFNRESSVPISKAIAASSAVPGLYRPIRLNGVDYVDGCVRGNASIDLAVERGANVIVCINPIVPKNGPSMMAHHDVVAGDDSPQREISMQAVMSQVMRTRMHAGLHYHIKHLRHVYPHVDFYVIEPEQNDRSMSAPNLMRWSEWRQIACQAFESVSWQLARDHETWAATWAQHHIEVAPGLEESKSEQGAEWPPPARDQRRGNVVLPLKKALTKLEVAIAGTEEGSIFG